MQGLALGILVFIVTQQFFSYIVTTRLNGEESQANLSTN
jgi:hypothetical protein